MSTLAEDRIPFLTARLLLNRLGWHLFYFCKVRFGKAKSNTDRGTLSPYSDRCQLIFFSLGRFVVRLTDFSLDLKLIGLSLLAVNIPFSAKNFSSGKGVWEEHDLCRSHVSPLLLLSC
ncbi:hypothetical protein SUGI_0832380 [Cryptomeria japonica]|nr:hypothetical protein SUGI_0832380 [Cryptomeria japonica]